MLRVHNNYNNSSQRFATFADWLSYTILRELQYCRKRNRLPLKHCRKSFSFWLPGRLFEGWLEYCLEHVAIAGYLQSAI
jgi:hypothetical protein